MLNGFRRYSASLLAVSPSIIAVAACLYGAIVWMAYISFTRSRMAPNYDLVGILQYGRLLSDERWHTALKNLVVFGTLLVVLCIAIGTFLAILMDQHIRLEGVFRTIYLYPLSISYIVTGLVWQWLLNPQFGFQGLVRNLGFADFRFDWLSDPDRAIYTILIASLWHGTGLVMALMLSGLRGIDPDIWRASRIDGIAAWRVYWNVVLPMLAPLVATCVMLLSLLSLRAYDLVIALTGGGPGYSSDLPGKFIVDFASERANLGLAAAAAVEMLIVLGLLLAPYMIFNARQRRE
jgi:glucose/mannose transport system permease protein